jgi:hypothetical protein
MRATLKNTVGFALRKDVLAVAASVVCLLGARSAKAGSLAIALQETVGLHVFAEDQVAIQPAFYTFGTSYSNNIGDFTVVTYGDSAIDGASLSSLLSSTTSITNDSSATATLVLYATEQDYTLPANSVLNVESSLTGTLDAGTMDSGLFQAFADASNTAYGTNDFTNGLQTVSGSPDFITGAANGFFSNSGSFYSITSVATITLEAGATVNYSDQVHVTAAPLPKTIWNGSALLGLLGVSQVVRRFRPNRRKNVVA